MKKLTVLIIGNGGREHALAWALRRSPRVGQLYIAPGNPGTAACGENIPITSNDLDGLMRFAADKQIDLTVVGPEAPLAAGIVDRFQAAGLAIFGPTQAAAQLESSKAFSKRFMQEVGLPTATAGVFGNYDAARQYLEALAGPVVVKASGLAAGKGVVVCDNTAEAQAALQQMMVERAFGDAADEVLIEERLIGPELSVLAFSDGRHVVPLLPARDHKRVGDHDQGPNTGGMGAYAPATGVDQTLLDQIQETILQPTVTAMAERGTPYVGVLYAGLMLTADGPKILEFNCRFGDPETQVVLPLLDGDLAEIMLACVRGELTAESVGRRPGACATVVMAAPGYPAAYPTGLPITGLDALGADDRLVFHAGTAVQDDQLVTAGGRVLAVSGLGPNLEAAIERAYQGVAQIHFQGSHYRHDIGRTIR